MEILKVYIYTDIDNFVEKGFLKETLLEKYVKFPLTSIRLMKPKVKVLSAKAPTITR